MQETGGITCVIPTIMNHQMTGMMTGLPQQTKMTQACYNKRLGYARDTIGIAGANPACRRESPSVVAQQ